MPSSRSSSRSSEPRHGAPLHRAVVAHASRRRAGSRASAPPLRGSCFGSLDWRGGLRVRAVLIVGSDDEKIIGPRFIRLLGAVNTLGSIRQAAASLGIGYRHAIAWIGQAEAVLGQRLVERRAGGTAGGGATNTTEATALIAAYERTAREIRRVLVRAERTFFPGAADAHPPTRATR